MFEPGKVVYFHDGTRLVAWRNSGDVLCQPRKFGNHNWEICAVAWRNSGKTSFEPGMVIYAHGETRVVAWKNSRGNVFNPGKPCIFNVEIRVVATRISGFVWVPARKDR